MRRRKPVLDNLEKVANFRPAISLKQIIQLTSEDYDRRA
jgi:phage FluMu protein gp41